MFFTAAKVISVVRFSTAQHIEMLQSLQRLVGTRDLKTVCGKAWLFSTVRLFSVWVQYAAYPSLALARASLVARGESSNNFAASCLLTALTLRPQ